MSATWYAHSANKAGHRETLAEHLRSVARRAEQYASAFGAREQAAAAGLLHDIGKYADQFQRRLDPTQRERGRDHWTAGAALAAACYKHRGLLPAIAIQAHHTGLTILEPTWREFAESLKAILADPDALTDPDLSRLKTRFDADGLSLPKVADGLVPSGSFSANDMLDARMLFSALVDADFVETEAHFEGTVEQPRKYRPEGPPLAAAPALAAVEAHVRQLAAHSDAAAAVQSVRGALYNACLAAAGRRPGLFTLSAPTGSGKTLAMLAFALRHAEDNDLRRVVLVMPFLNIIDQTVKVYREVFSPANAFEPHYVLEDHSLAEAREHREDRPDDDQDEERITRRLLAQNWDAPIILTTNVKCLESLMSNRPSACRKLHRLARSVILFDEVQTLPKELAVATLATLGRLSERYSSTVVFATASQPAFDHLNDAVRELSPSGWRPLEIVPPSEMEGMFRTTAERVRVRWRHDEPTRLEELAEAILSDAHQQVLCIVNLKRHAARLAELLKQRSAEGLFHLSTSMCPAHRKQVLDDVREILKAGDAKAVRLVATQCVEAGVDVDFPVVYRALGPLEAIAQAAGRCNRHGRRPQAGAVHVFRPADEEGKGIYPPGYAQAAQTTTTFLNALRGGQHPLDDMEIIQAPDRLRAYFRQLYDVTGVGAGVAGKERDLRAALDACDFAEVARLYRLIDHDGINILVPYDRDRFQELRDEILQAERPTADFIRAWIARARPFAVSLYRPRADSPAWNHLQPIPFGWRDADIEEAGWFACLPGRFYDGAIGLVLPETPGSLIV